MRYVVSMLFALVGAVLAAVFVGSTAADWIVAHQTFDSSDDAENLHMLAFIGTLVGGLVVGWLFGWIIGGSGRSAPPSA
ncbi:MAG: hypothetical protein WC829_11310 [Hyphomicrobium sp.]|jgi:NhaP-type Na+/H+ or K+/H+ antiporter